MSGTVLAFHRVMERKRLGASALAITPIGLGTWALGGGDWVLGWGPQDDRQSVATIRRAIDLGVNWIDSSPVFGLGRAETLVARALAGLPLDQRPYLFVRYGLIWDELGNVSHDLRPESIRAQAEGSLRRLQTDHIDLFEIGWPSWPVPTMANTPAKLEETLEAMVALQREGKVRHLGVSGCSTSQLGRIQSVAQLTSWSVPYSLLRRELEQCAGQIQAAGHMGVIACSTLGAGLLTGSMTPDHVRQLPCNDWRRRHPFFQEMARTRAPIVVDRLRLIAERHGVSPAAVATAWTLRQPWVTAAVVGARRPAQVDELVQAASLQLNADELAALDRDRGNVRECVGSEEQDQAGIWKPEVRSLQHHG